MMIYDLVNTQLGLFLILGRIIKPCKGESLLPFYAGSTLPAMLLASLIAGIGL
jgi:hypothetical protein